MKPDDENTPINGQTPITPDESTAAPQPTLEDQREKPDAGAPVPAPETVQIAKKTPWVTQALRFLLVAVLFFIAGAAVIYLTYTRDAFKKIDALQAAATESAQQITTLQTDLAQNKADLKTSTGKVEELQTSLDAANLKLLVSKMEIDVNTARIALLSLDPGGATQALSFAQRDLTALTNAGLDAKSIAGFQDRLDEASSNLTSDPAKAQSALEKLISGLYLLETNLK